jgi:hypothetical protein
MLFLFFLLFENKSITIQTENYATSMMQIQNDADSMKYAMHTLLDDTLLDD